MLESHVGFWLQADTGTEDVGQSSALFGERVDDRSAWRGEGSLQHVAENAQNTMESRKVLGANLARLPLDTSHHLSDQDKINDQWRSQERILANIEDADGLVSTKENLRVVLIKSTLVVTHGWHVLDDDAMIWMLALLVKDIVGSDHVVDNVGLGDLLGAELLLRRQVLAIVVAEMVVGGDGGQLDTGADEEVNESRLHLCLAGFEVVATDEGLVFVGEFNAAWHEGVLGRSVDERSAFEDTGNSEDGRWSDFFVARFDGVDEVVGGVIDAGDKISEALGIGGPLDDDLFEVVGSLEVAECTLVLK